MTISACIPVYNTNITELIKSLVSEVKLYQLPVEVVVIDDCSSESYKVKNESIKDSVNYIQLTENIGRAKIRNAFLNYAKCEYLLFIDGDSKIIADDFLRNYLDIINQKKETVICGGSIYQSAPPERSKYLRWKVSRVKEQNKRSFKTNSFLIKKDILSKVKFNESIKGIS